MLGHIFVVFLGWPALVAVCSLAWWKGDRPSRLSGGILMIGALIAWLINFQFGRVAGAVPMLLSEGLMAMGFLFVAVRYASLWLGAVMVLQGIQFSLHAYYFVIERSHDYLYGLINNLDTYAIMACILGGTITAWRRRVQARQRQLLATP
jgi:hypothetical protein